MPSEDFIQKMKAKLLEAKAHLTEELTAVPHHEEIGDRLDDAALEQSTDDVNKDVSERIKQDLEDIDSALERIEAGTYGLDIDSGEPIDEKRLEVYPWAKKAI